MTHIFESSLYHCAKGSSSRGVIVCTASSTESHASPQPCGTASGTTSRSWMCLPPYLVWLEKEVSSVDSSFVVS